MKYSLTLFTAGVGIGLLMATLIRFKTEAVNHRNHIPSPRVNHDVWRNGDASMISFESRPSSWLDVEWPNSDPTITNIVIYTSHEPTVSHTGITSTNYFNYWQITFQ